jgi:hypothetical protein
MKYIQNILSGLGYLGLLLIMSVLAAFGVNFDKTEEDEC